MVPEQEPRRPGWWQTALSVLAAFFGVQSRANRERDFQHGRPLQFIVVGVLATAVFVGLVILAVRFALAQAG